MSYQNSAEHPALPQPEDSESLVWRYMDLPKLIALLGQRALFFSRLDKLGDPYEGSITAPLKERLDLASHETAERFAAFRKQYRMKTFVNCWRRGQNESEAMWRLYCGMQGVVIQTTYAKLKASIKQWNNPSIGIGLVTYRDYVADDIRSQNFFIPLMSKRVAFNHENEVRIVWSMVGQNYPKENTVWENGVEGRPEPVGMLLPWNPDDFVENIYISPYADPWYGDVIKTTVEKFFPRLAANISWSPMRSDPYY